MEIEYSRNFIKHLRKLSSKIQLAFRARVRLFEQDKFNRLLNNHALKGDYLGYRSINITGDWRALFLESNDGKKVHFELLNTHSELYG